jgi:hypothetical protein
MPYHSYPYWLRKNRKNINYKALKEYIRNVIDQYKAGQFRYDCMGYTASLGRRAWYTSPERAQLGSAQQNRLD